MTDGKVLYGVSAGVYVLKFIGEVRLDLCAAIDVFVDRLVHDVGLRGVIVDLSETRQIDSTSLGLLAKLSLGSREVLHELPTLICNNPEVLRFLASMGFNDVFHIVDMGDTDADMSAVRVPDIDQFGELPERTASEAETRRRVLAAHRALMDLNDNNRRQFSDLVRMLEAEQ